MREGIGPDLEGLDPIGTDLSLDVDIHGIRDTAAAMREVSNLTVPSLFSPIFGEGTKAETAYIGARDDAYQALNVAQTGARTAADIVDTLADQLDWLDRELLGQVDRAEAGGLTVRGRFVLTPPMGNLPDFEVIPVAEWTPDMVDLDYQLRLAADISRYSREVRVFIDRWVKQEFVPKVQEIPEVTQPPAGEMDPELEAMDYDSFGRWTDETHARQAKQEKEFLALLEAIEKDPSLLKNESTLSKLLADLTNHPDPKIAAVGQIGLPIVMGVDGRPPSEVLEKIVAILGGAAMSAAVTLAGPAGVAARYLVSLLAPALTSEMIEDLPPQVRASYQRFLDTPDEGAVAPRRHITIGDREHYEREKAAQQCLPTP